MEILVNNAGVTYFKELVSTTANEFDHVMDTNVRGMFLLTKAVLPSFLRRRRGLIINILSFAAKTVYTGSSIYSASKSAGSAMMGVLREEVRDKGIKILNVFPGAVSTPMWGTRNRARFEHRMIHPEEIAEYIVATAALPASMMVEEITLRPQRGDLKI
jgi:NADP-dependent 3-hydroxy acid dehydrogenase YdfG